LTTEYHIAVRNSLYKYTSTLPMSVLATSAVVKLWNVYKEIP